MGRHSGVIILNAPYTVSYIHYTRLMAQRDNGLDNRDQSFKTIFPIIRIQNTQYENQRFSISFRYKNNETKQRGEKRRQV